MLRLKRLARVVLRNQCDNRNDSCRSSYNIRLIQQCLHVWALQLVSVVKVLATNAKEKLGHEMREWKSTTKWMKFGLFMQSTCTESSESI